MAVRVLQRGCIPNAYERVARPRKHHPLKPPPRAISRGASGHRQAVRVRDALARVPVQVPQPQHAVLVPRHHLPARQRAQRSNGVLLAHVSQPLVRLRPLYVNAVPQLERVVGVGPTAHGDAAVFKMRGEGGERGALLGEGVLAGVGLCLPQPHAAFPVTGRGEVVGARQVSQHAERASGAGYVLHAHQQIAALSTRGCDAVALHDA